VLAQALAGLREHSGRVAHDTWRWVLVGDGPFLTQLRAFASELGLSNNIVFAGRLPDRDLHAWYEIADLFVHPTLYEGSSLVTLEAMAHRRACVVTDAGGLRDKVRNGVNGWIVAPGDAAALAAAISGALEDANRRREMGSAGRGIVEREFSWTSAARATMALYQRLLQRT
jgi:glycosyltransferase involved in cell wall biosynthesis